MATIKHKVVRGDTLSALAKKYKTTVSSIAKLNKIRNVNRIYVGQVLYISGKPSSSGGSGGGGSASKPTSKPANNATITMFGLQSDTERTIFAVWTWSKSNTDKYRVEWDYYTKNNTWFNGSHTDVTHSTTKESTFNMPANATKVRFRVKPISKTYTKDNKTVSYWTADWTGYKYYDANSLPPKVPPTPTVEVKDYSIICKLDNLDVNADQIQFEVVKNNTTLFNTGTTSIKTTSTSYSCKINAGDTYKARARSKRGSSYSDWSNYSSEISTKPSKPTAINTCKATSKTSVLLKWDKVVTADKYEIEYATKKEYFDGSNATTKIEYTTNQYEITGLNTGERYFFRVRAVNSKGDSAWTGLVSVVIGTKPIAPTTWSSTTTAISGEELKLYWVHNSEDESSETMAELEIYYDSKKVTHTVKNTNTDENNKTSQYIVDTSTLSEGAIIKWRVRTAGITQEYGDWSTQRTINVYAPPTLSLEILNNNGEPLTVLDSFPFYIRGVAGPATQTPISFHVSIIAKQSYETVDEVGNVKMVIAGEEVYSSFYDISTELMLEIMPGSVDLQNSIDYDITCTVAMDSGLSAQETNTFSVSWIDETFTPNAEISIDPDTLAAHIRPFCEYYPDVYYQVEYTNEQYIKTDIVLGVIDGISVDNAFTTEDDVVYAGMHNGVLTHFCIRTSETAVSVPNITLSVYRREYNGSFIEIGTGLENEAYTFVTDPHPTLDYARYRIVAISNSTGSVSYTDLPGYAVNEKAVIIQWDETWSNFDVSTEGFQAEPSWAGSMIKLPYNIDISDSNTNDVTLVNYIGRKHPVSYYGTQVGATATWNMDIPKTDIDTLYALRRLSIWMGDVYVREPSGGGYWANVSISFSQTHKELVIPITINITRVEGGV